MKFNFKLDSILDRLKNDFHVPVAIFIFLVATAIHVITGKDLGPQYVNSIYATYGFLAGHAFVQNKWGNNDDAPAPTTATTPTGKPSNDVPV